MHEVGSNDVLSAQPDWVVALDSEPVVDPFPRVHIDRRDIDHVLCPKVAIYSVLLL